MPAVSDAETSGPHEGARSFYERLFTARGALISRDPSGLSSLETACNPEHGSVPQCRESRAADSSVMALPPAKQEMSLQMPSPRRNPSEPATPRAACDHEHRPATDVKHAASFPELGAALATGDESECRMMAAQHLPSLGHPSQQLQAKAGPMPLYGIPRANVGFQMLQKAGWKEGTGAPVSSNSATTLLHSGTELGCCQGCPHPKSDECLRVDAVMCQCIAPSHFVQSGIENCTPGRFVRRREGQGWVTVSQDWGGTSRGCRCRLKRALK